MPVPKLVDLLEFIFLITKETTILSLPVLKPDQEGKAHQHSYWYLTDAQKCSPSFSESSGISIVSINKLKKKGIG